MAVGADGGRSGFTLIEVMAALAILGTALLILLNTHFKSMSLHERTDQAVFMDGLMSWAMGAAETEVQSGVLNGDGDFGERYEGYSYSFSATLFDESMPVALYTVAVFAHGPDDDRTLMMLVYRAGGASQQGSLNQGLLNQGMSK